MHQLRLFPVLLLLSVSGTVSAQSREKKVAKPLYNAGGVKIELAFTQPKKTCDSVNAKTTKYLIYVTGKDLLKSLSQYMNFKIDYVDCQNNLVEKNVSVDLYTLNERGNSNSDWEFMASSIEREFYDERLEDSPNNAKDRIKGRSQSIAPDSIVGKSDIVLGEPVTLRLIGGQLTKDAKWVWYSGSCPGGTREGEGETFTRNNITKTTTYYVRAEGPRGITSCVSRKVVVDNNSRPADGIEGRNLVCNTASQNILLFVVGGKKGLGARWVWYEGNCNSNKKLGEGDSILVSPQSTTTYFVRAESQSVNPTICVEHTIEVLSPSVSPSSILVTQPNSCASQAVTLAVNGGRLSKNAVWLWRAVGASNTVPREIGTGNTVADYPDEQTVYSVSAQDDVCPSSDETKTTVNVKSLSQDPSSIQVTKVKRNQYSLTAQGGSLGDGAKWVWYRNGCENGERITSNQTTIQYKAKKGENNIFVRAEGDCGNSQCVETGTSQVVRVARSHVDKKQNFWYINGGVVAQNTEQINNILLTLGCRWVYVSAKLPLEKGEKYSYNSIGGIVETLPAGTSPQFTGTNYYTHSAFTGGVLIGGNGLRIYLGGGVGKYQDIRQFNLVKNSGNLVQSTEYARSADGELSGTEAEGGLFLRMGSITLMGGVSSLFINSRPEPFIDYHLSLGFKL